MMADEGTPAPGADLPGATADDARLLAVTAARVAEATAAIGSLPVKTDEPAQVFRVPLPRPVGA